MKGRTETQNPILLMILRKGRTETMKGRTETQNPILPYITHDSEKGKNRNPKPMYPYTHVKALKL